MERRIEVRACSITDGGTDCVVNASNNTATLGGGVSNALCIECGPKLQAEMRTKLEDEFNESLDEGDCMVTSAGASSKFRFVLHVPAVDYSGTKARLASGGVERTVTSVDRIRACTEAALREAAEIGSREGKPVSVTFPLLGAGAGGLSIPAVCQALISGLRAFFSDEPEAPIERVVFAVPEVGRFATCERLIEAAFR